MLYRRLVRQLFEYGVYGARLFENIERIKKNISNNDNRRA